MLSLLPLNGHATPILLLIIAISDSVWVVRACGGLNVGTTLFTKADTYRECWSDESLALLTSRMLFDDILPATATALCVDSDQYVDEFVRSCHVIFNEVRNETHGESKHIVLKAVTDVLGEHLSPSNYYIIM